jgi:hypothetical protein
MMTWQDNFEAREHILQLAAGDWEATKNEAERLNVRAEELLALRRTLLWLLRQNRLEPPISVTQHERHDGLFDFLGRDRNGRTFALEVTSASPQRLRQVEALKPKEAASSEDGEARATVLLDPRVFENKRAKPGDDRLIIPEDLSDSEDLSDECKKQIEESDGWAGDDSVERKLIELVREAVTRKVKKYHRPSTKPELTVLFVVAEEELPGTWESILHSVALREAFEHGLASANGHSFDLVLVDPGRGEEGVLTIVDGLTPPASRHSRATSARSDAGAA